MPRLLPILVLLTLAGLVACPKPAPTVEPESSGSGAEVPGGAVDPGPDPVADGGDEVPDGVDPNTPPTTTCLSDSDCNDGVCEGQGCGDDEPGACKPKARMCTRDSRPYCGCDGQTFRASGTCPGRRYLREGECTGSAPMSDSKAP